jgi:hypothetical protein
MYVSYEQWMRGTQLGITKPRSTQLKAVDNALKQYDRLRTKKQLEYLQYAFYIWKGSKGSGWKESERNRTGMVTDLDDMLKMPVTNLTPMEMILQDYQSNLNKLFKSRKLESRNSSLHKRTYDSVMLGLKTKKIYGAANEVKNIATLMKPAMQNPALVSKFNFILDDLISVLFDEVKNSANWLNVKKEIITELGPQFFGEFIKAMTPYLGLIVCGGTAIIDWGKTVRDTYRKYKLEKRTDVVKAGTPKAALDAIKVIIDRERNNHITTASINTVEFGVKGILQLTGVGGVTDTIVGGITAFTKICHTLALVAFDYKEKRDANKIMQTAKNIDHKIFDACPILGCYYIVSSDTSNVINFIVEDMGKDGWMDDIENMKQNLDYIESQARRLIDEHRYVIKDMPKMKMSDERMEKQGIDVSRTEKIAFSVKRARGKLPF